MAVIDVDLACTQAAFVTDASPSTNYHGAAKYQLAGDNASSSYQGNRLLLSFEDLPEEYRYRLLLSADIKFTANRNYSLGTSCYIVANLCGAEFDETSVTWDTKPGPGSAIRGGAVLSYGSGDADGSITAHLSTAGDDAPEAAKAVLDAPGLYLTTSDRLHGSSYADVYAKAAAAGKKPFLRISVSDTNASVKTTATAPESYDLFDKSQPCTFSWDLDFLTRGGLAPIEQTSATIYWRKSGTEDPWQTVTVSGDVRSYTFPADTFPAGDIVWYVEPTVVGYNVFGSSYSWASPRIVVDMAATALAGVHRRNNPDVNYPWTGDYTLWIFPDAIVPTDYYNLLFSAEPLPSLYNYQAITDAGLCFSTNIDAGTAQALGFYKLVSGFDPGAVTWNTKPANDGAEAGGGGYDNRNGTQFVRINDFFARENGANRPDRSRNALAILQSPGFMLQAHTSSPPAYADGASYFYVLGPVRRRAMLLDLIVTSKPAATTNASGYVNPHVAQAFRWQHVPDGDYWCVAGWTTQSATLYWRQAGASTWNSVAAAAGSSEVILAANTMPAGSVEWYVTATDDQGTTASSDVYAINTQDGLHTATPITPDGSLENGDAAIRFVWSDSSDTGADPGGADLAYSDDDGTTWTTFAQPRTSATQYDTPGDTLPSGAVSWRVRSINAEGTAGEWSSPLSFLCFASPDAPIVTADGKPLLTVTWQSAEQQAYEITVDGVKHGPYFGTSKSWQAPDYLADGSHSVSIRVQNEYGLWSDPGAITVTIVNQPGAPITLSGLFNRDAELRWATENNTGNYLIYRDDVRIGHAGSTSFTDRTCLGYHAWKVFAVLPDGYYTASNIVNGELSAGCPTIAALSGGGWIDLKLSSSSDRSMMWNHNQSVTMRQFAGREYPDIEVAPYRSTSVSFDVAWKYSEADLAAAFANLVGRPVILKTSCEGVLVGILSAWQRENTQFFKAYTCTVQRINWRDYTDADS